MASTALDKKCILYDSQAEASSPGAVTASSQLGLHRKTSTESLLSPLRSATSELNHLTPKNNPTSAFNSPLAAIREESSTSPVKSTASNQASNDEVFSTPVPPSHHSTQVGSSSQVPRPPPLPVAGVAGFSPRQVTSASLASTPTNSQATKQSSVDPGPNHAATGWGGPAGMSDVRAMMLAFPDTLTDTT